MRRLPRRPPTSPPPAGASPPQQHLRCRSAPLVPSCSPRRLRGLDRQWQVDAGSQAPERTPSSHGAAGSAEGDGGEATGARRLRLGQSPDLTPRRTASPPTCVLAPGVGRPPRTETAGSLCCRKDRTRRRGRVAPPARWRRGRAALQSRGGGRVPRGAAERSVSSPGRSRTAASTAFPRPTALPTAGGP